MQSFVQQITSNIVESEMFKRNNLARYENNIITDISAGINRKQLQCTDLQVQCKVLCVVYCKIYLFSEHKTKALFR